MIDASRHYSLFSPAEWGEKRVDVLGLQGYASDLALGLAKFGVQNLHVWDDGYVLEEELTESAFSREHIGMRRVDAIREIILKFTGTEVQIHTEGPGTKKILGTVVFLAYADIESRKLAWKTSPLRYNLKVEVIFEPRPGFEKQRIFTIEPKNSTHLKDWEASLEEFPPHPGCGEMLSAATQWAFIRWSKKDKEDPPVFCREFKAAFPASLAAPEYPAPDSRDLVVVGVGAVGSRIASTLSRLGWSQICGYDFDDVSSVNVANQAFGIHHVGQPKVLALQSLILEQTGIEIKALHEKVDGSQTLNGIVFLAVDSMRARKEIFSTALENNPNCERIIEVRMGVREFRVYSFDPNNAMEVAEWQKSLTDDDPRLVERSPCGMPISIGPTAQLLAAFAVRNFLRFLSGGSKPPFSTMFKTQTMFGVERTLSESVPSQVT